MKYVDGRVHTNGMENFWSLLKRGLNGTYVSVEPFHLFRFLDEQAYRYNNRKDADDFDRFVSPILLKLTIPSAVTAEPVRWPPTPYRRGYAHRRSLSRRKTRRSSVGDHASGMWTASDSGGNMGGSTWGISGSVLARCA